MGKTAVEEYNEWDLSPLRTPVRSTLFSLDPIGARTPWVESLTSYIARLADAHCVFTGVLVDRFVVPLVPGYSPLDRQHGLFRADGYKSNLVNATGHRAMYAIQALELLTQRTDLRHLTLLALSDVLYIRGLIRETRAWCPVCYEEWQRAGQVVYDQLLWAFLEVSVCLHHEQRLRTQCPYQDCARRLPALAWRSRPGYCAFCQRWLGMISQETEVLPLPIEETELIWQRWVSESLGAVLTLSPTIVSPPQRQQMTEKVIHLVHQISGEKRITAFAEALGMSTNMVGHWYYGKRLPQIGMLLRLCYSLGLPLSDLLLKNADTLHPYLTGKLPGKSRVPPKNKPINVQYVRRILEETLASEEYPPLPLAEVARRLGHQQVELYKIHRTACYQISARYRAYLQQRKETRMQGYRDEIRQIALELRAQNVSLTRKHIAPHLAQPAILRDPKIRELLEEVCRELGANNGVKSL